MPLEIGRHGADCVVRTPVMLFSRVLLPPVLKRIEQIIAN
jgi:hypothetical protein